MFSHLRSLILVSLLAVTALGASVALAQDGEGTITKEDFHNRMLIFSPSTRPEVFVSCIDNPLYPLIPGTVYHYTEGEDTVTVTVTDQTRGVMGIEATVVHDVVASQDGQVQEDTWDWYAQDDRGNVWYLGEDTQELNNGEVVSTEGSWEGGVDGALPGIIMLAQPRPGDVYYQEYYEGHAEDMGAIAALNQAADVPFGSFTNTVQTAAYNPIDDELEHKWYAPGIGVVQEAVGGEVSAQLIEVTHDLSLAAPDRQCGVTGGVPFVGTTVVTEPNQDLEALASVTADEAQSAALGVVAEGAQVSNSQLTVVGNSLVYLYQMDDGTVVAVDAGDAAPLFVGQPNAGGQSSSD